MKLNRKGFTLVELLVTIVIVGLVVGLSVFGIISLVNNYKEETKILSVDNIKEAARIYSTEVSSDSWKSNSDYDAFCVSISELMNKGLLDKKASINDNYTKDSFVIVKRNKVTLAIDNVDMVSEDINEEYNRVCTGQVLEEEDYDRPVIEEYTSYTDRIEIPFTSGDAESGVKNYSCLYGETSSSVNREGVIEGNNCILDGLKNNKEYYVLIYMNTNKGSSILADGNRNYKTADFNDTEMHNNNNNNTLIVQYDNNNIKDRKGYYYFKSDVDTRSLSKIEICTLNNNKFSCTDSTNEVKSGVWYRTINSNVQLVYSSDYDTFDVNTKICDKSYNCHDNSETINIYNVKFYRNGAVKIDGTTNEYVERYCLAIDGSSCSVTSPKIFIPVNVCSDDNRRNEILGWNIKSSAKEGLYKGSTIEVNSNMNLYAIFVFKYFNLDFNWILNNLPIYYHGVGDTTADKEEAQFKLKINGNLWASGDGDYYGYDYCNDDFQVDGNKIQLGSNIMDDLVWEIDGLKLNGTEIYYYKKGSFSNGDSFLNIQIYSLNININDPGLGSVSSNMLYVLPGTTYSVNGNTLRLSDGRSVTASEKSGDITIEWSSYGGKINGETAITVNFIRH